LEGYTDRWRGTGGGERVGRAREGEEGRERREEMEGREEGE